MIILDVPETQNTWLALGAYYQDGGIMNATERYNVSSRLYFWDQGQGQWQFAQSIWAYAVAAFESWVSDNVTYLFGMCVSLFLFFQTNKKHK